MMMASKLATLALRVEEWLLHHARRGPFAPVLDRDLDLEPGLRSEMRRAQMRERDVLFQQRRPAAARRIAGLLGAGVDRHAHAPGGRRQPRRKADLRIEALERVPLDLDSGEAPRSIPCGRGPEFGPSDH